MALTAVVTVGLSTAQINTANPVSVVITNGGGAAVTLTSVMPFIVATGAAPALPTATAIGQTPLGPNTQTSIPAAGALQFTTECFGMAPGPYTVGCNIVDTTGTVTVATTAAFTATPPPLPASEL